MRAIHGKSLTTAAALLPVALAAALAGCGGSVAQQSATAASAPSPLSTVAAATHTGDTATGSRAKPHTAHRRDRISSHEAPAQPSTGVARSGNDEVSATGAKVLNPCSLVTRGEAQRILRHAVGPLVEGPQGPTCIYKLAGTKRTVTLAVEPANVSKVKPQAQLRNRRKVTVRAHTGYCGTLGGPLMVVPLSGGRVLSITAPCSQASSFAAIALGRLRA